MSGFWFHILFLSIVSIPTFAAGPQCSTLFSEPVSASANMRFSILPSRDLTALRPLSRGNFEATLGVNKVFLKKLRGDSTQEAAWLQYLNTQGLGVKLHGLVKLSTQNGESLYMVIENAPGVNTQFAMLAPEGFRLSKSMVQEIRRQADLLASLEIIPVDLQFQVSADGTSIKIIDPELFRRASNQESAAVQTERILSNLFLSWSMEGKVDL